MTSLHVQFGDALPPTLATLEIGSGRVTTDSANGVVRLTIRAEDAQHYHDAQLWDYARLTHKEFPDRAPLQMTIRARFSHQADALRGTAGFGFWNQPVMPNQWLPRLPRYCWFFFGSPPTNMKFDLATPGSGWKAATLDMSRWLFLLLAPFTPIGFLLMRIPALYRALWPVAQRIIGVAEQTISVDLREWHSYRLTWRTDGCQFFVDDQLLLETATAPRGALGFVAWIDNQFAVVTPQGQLGMGLLAAPDEQWLEIASLDIRPL
ncbi:MAG: hypothetical protein KF716_33910 [Anaerolineae bacterium]|nr:hypothetical protein [Anaerolineae bacterium]